VNTMYDEGVNYEWLTRQETNKLSTTRFYPRRTTARQQQK